MLKRITISLSEELYNRIVQDAPTKNISGYISSAVEDKLDSSVIENTKDPVDALMELREKLPKFSLEEVLESRKIGRM